MIVKINCDLQQEALANNVSLEQAVAAPSGSGTIPKIQPLKRTRALLQGVTIPMAKAKKSKAKKSKAKKSTARKSKAKKPKKAARATKAKVKSKKSKKPVRKAAAKKPAPKKAAKKAKPAKQIVGEGDYAASRSFLKDQSGFVKRNQARIPAMGKAAEAALEGPEGSVLRAAEEEAKSHSHE